MQLTNRFGVDPAIARAIASDPYEHGGDISVSTLCKPPQIAALEWEHQFEVTEDVSDRLWALLGQAVHVVLERAGGDNELPEERLYADVLGWQIAGRPDLWREPDEIVDFKCTSVWSFILGDKPEWEMSLNLYAALYRRHGFPVNKLTIAAILRDHVKSKALSDPDYPPIPFMQVDVPLWTPDEAERFLEERVRLHQAARGGDYPPCTDAERWRRDDKWAVMKGGRKTAIRVLTSEGAALKVLESEQRASRGDFYIQHRPGTDARCEAYCSVMEWCSQAKALGVTSKRVTE